MFQLDSQPLRCRELHHDAVPSQTKSPPRRMVGLSRTVRSTVQTRLCATAAELAFWLRESGRVNVVLTIYWTLTLRSFYNHSSGDLGTVSRILWRQAFFPHKVGTRRTYRGGIPGIGNERCNVFLCVRTVSDGPVFPCGRPKRSKSETRLSLCRLSTTPANAAFGLILREISGNFKLEDVIKRGPEEYLRVQDSKRSCRKE